MSEYFRCQICGEKNESELLQDCQEKLKLTEMREIGFLEALKISEEKLEAERKLSDRLAGRLDLECSLVRENGYLTEISDLELKAYRDARGENGR